MVLSVAKTRLDWYIVPAYPYLAVLIGLGGPRLATFLLKSIPGRTSRISLRLLFAVLLLLPPLITIWHELRGNRRDSAAELRAGYGVRELGLAAAPPQPLAVVAAPGFNAALRPITAAGGAVGYNASLRFYILAYPRTIRVIAAADVAALRGPGYVLTANPSDSIRVRTAFPQAPHRATGRYRCWLWTLPAADSGR